MDDIPGQRTRAAMHKRLCAAPLLVFGPRAPAGPNVPPELFREIDRIRGLVAEAGRRLEAITTAP